MARILTFPSTDYFPASFICVFFCFLQMCSSPELSNKELYPTFVRTYAQTTKLSDSVLLLLEEFSWTKVGILFEKTSKWIDIKDNMKKHLRLKGIELRAEKELPKSDDFDMDPNMYMPVIKQTLKDIKDQARSECICK